MKLVLENIRTFSGRHVLPIKPLTILTGENSSGKTTVLGMLSALCDRESYPLQPNFNKPPFNFGNYESIATFKGGRFGRAKSFRLGFIRDDSSEGELTHVESNYRNHRGQVELDSVEAKGPSFQLSIHMEPAESIETAGAYTIKFKDDTIRGNFSIPRIVGESRSYSLLQVIMQSVHLQPDNLRITQAAMDFLWRLSPGDAVAIAPIRTQPERVYSQASEAFKPTGDHIPFYLEQLFRDESTTKQRDTIVNALKRFGEESGLFRNFTVKHLGQSASAPFQLMVTVSGLARNLIDVGYGVSQALPVVVQAVLTQYGHILLLQQPEVHLHPKAQAALGTFFSELVRDGSRQMIIETHSDYIIDRVRQEVAAGNLTPEAVNILYMHRKGLETYPYVIGIDSDGNLTNVPANYREFFLEEETNLFNRGSRS